MLVFTGGLVGIPPLSGFVVKVLLLCFFSAKFSVIFFLGVFILIIISTVFYIQLLKLLKQISLEVVDIKSGDTAVPFDFSERNEYLEVTAICWLLFFSIFYIFFCKDFTLCFLVL